MDAQTLVGELQSYGDDEVPEWDGGKWECKEQHGYLIDCASDTY